MLLKLSMTLFIILLFAGLFSVQVSVAIFYKSNYILYMLVLIWMMTLVLN